MKCNACGGKMTVITGGKSFDLRAVCKDCGAVRLKESRSSLAVKFCNCAQVKPEHEIPFDTPTGHGRLHALCGQITQLG